MTPTPPRRTTAPAPPPAPQAPGPAPGDTRADARADAHERPERAAAADGGAKARAVMDPPWPGRAADRRMTSAGNRPTALRPDPPAAPDAPGPPPQPDRAHPPGPYDRAPAPPGTGSATRAPAPAPRHADRTSPPGPYDRGPGERARPRHRGFRVRGAGALVAADCLGAAAGAGAGRAGAVAAGVLVAVFVGGQRRAGLYRPGFAPSALAEAPALASRAAVAWAVAAAVGGAGGGPLGRPALLLAFGVTALAACALRALVHGRRARAARRSPGSTLIVAAGPQGPQVAAALHAHPEYGMRPVGLVTPGPGAEPGDPAARLLAAALHAQAPGAPPDLPLPVLTGHGEITRAVIQNSVRHAVVVGPPALDARTTATVRLLAAQGCRVWHLSTGRGPVPPAHLWGFACRRVESEPYAAPRPGLRAKRATDAALAALALLALAPVLAACALAVRVADGPGVIFRQERIGLGGRPFTLLKFRTLRPHDAHESATRWSVAHESRMSRAGRLLRRTSLDELPQLWNVLRGDMSLVGPRPERPYFVEQFSRTHAGYADRHRMPAGITGLAQVHGLRGDTSIADRARFDNHYIDSWSWWQDLAILLRTAGALFRFGGS